MKAWRNGGMSIGHLEVDGMDRESPFLESGMFNEMSMGWDWWNRWVWVRSTINDSVSFKPGQWKCWVRSPINVFVMSITLRSIVTFLMPKLSNNTWVMSWLGSVRPVMKDWTIEFLWVIHWTSHYKIHHQNIYTDFKWLHTHDCYVCAYSHCHVNFNKWWEELTVSN